jgi:hypothetical protein
MRSVFISGGYPMECTSCDTRVARAKLGSSRGDEGWDGGLLSKLAGPARPNSPKLPTFSAEAVGKLIGTGRVAAPKPRLWNPKPGTILSLLDPPTTEPPRTHYYVRRGLKKTVTKGGKSFIDKTWDE